MIDIDTTGKSNVRHKLPDRLFHWTMALTVFVLLLSAFLPIVGIDFDWIPWHWISGVCLTAVVVFHLARVLFVQGLSEMLPRSHDFRKVAPVAQAKYDIYQKSYHWAVALIILTLIITGIPMLIKLDTFLWDRNPSILSDLSWGYVYVVHGISSLLLIFFLLLHIYFSFLPEHRLLLQSMIKG